MSGQPITRGVVHQEGCRTPWRWITTPLDSNHVPEFPRREPNQ